ncbi:hypothetical protein BLL40_00040 [Domibacillus mangrovi]|uniref:histidine kinase n=1 Tax=Domibacillus mangrovi TaxID=1714354 RepID=A0A1Q5P839_9BACI|nr:hypothetical protein BLL40_00040 [Domibacillus mangrovi]
MLIIVLIFFVLTGLRFLWLAYYLPPEQPIARNGILDLRNYEWKENQTIHLDGEWLFYPETLIDPDNLTSTASKSEPIILSIPSKEGDDSSHQFGTYRLKILLDKKQVSNFPYGIQIPAAKTASALFVNGQLEGNSGEVAASSSLHRGQNVPYTAYFTAYQQEIDITVHLSNFDTPEGALINKHVTFGSEQAVLNEQNNIKMLLFTIVVVLLIHSLYTILVYLFIYRKKIVLFFTAGFLFPAADELITYNKSIFGWLLLDYEWSLKISNLVYLGASFFFVHFMRVLLSKYQDAKRFRWFTILYGICALAIIVIPTHFLLSANTLFFTLYFVSFFSVVILALKEYIQEKEESIFLAFTALSTTSGLLWGLIKAFTAMEIPFYPFDYLFAFLGFAGFWFKRFYQKTTLVNELVDDLKKADQLKDDFLMSSSQKLWNPMNEMITIAQSIYDGENSSITIQDKNNLKYLIDIGRGMSFALNDLLDFTRLKEGTLHLHPKSTSVQGTVFGVFDMLRFITDGIQIQMISTIPKSFPNVLADEKRLIQILFNLLHNAIKYTNVGFIVVHAKIENGMATIHIQDTGLGIDEETQKRIFSPYEQGIASDNGIGLGLNVCKKLIELHGGTLQMQSVPNQGSNFFFTLPLAPEQINPDEEPTLQTKFESTIKSSVNATNDLKFESFRKQFMILAVDDDPINLKLISNIFSSEEYEVVTVTSGEDALKLLDKTEWDLIILDAMVPYTSGYALVRSIRDHYSILEVPILLLTARNYPEDVYTGLALGANDYVTKPINSLELKIRSRALIDLKYSINQRLHMEAAWLQAQIQPHFLFNTLNTIASLSSIDSERMVNLLNHFGEYLRGSFDVKNLQRVVPLHHELELVRSYLYIEQERFEELLHVKWEVDKSIDVDIPPISIQPLAENAVRHGILEKKNGGTVCIRVKNHAEHVEISITDDGVGMDEAIVKDLLSDSNDTRRGIGLRNTDRRLKRIYGQGLQISSVPNEGTQIMFNVPKTLK